MLFKRRKASKVPRHFIAAALLGLIFISVARSEVLPIKNYTSADGLIYETVIRIYQDAGGFLWFCTNVGVSRFDGYQFTSYAMQDGLANPTITDIIEDRNGVFWLGTNASGVYRFDPRQKTGGDPQKPVFTPFAVDAENKRGNAVFRFFKTRQGQIYAATHGGLYRLDDGPSDRKFFRVDLKVPTAPDQSFGVTSLVEDAAGESFWIGHQYGLSRLFPDGRAIHYAVRPKNNLDRVSSLAFDRQNRLWIITNDHGLAVYHPEPVVAGENSPGASRPLTFTNERPEDLKPGFARLFSAGESLAAGGFSEVYSTSDGKIWLTARGKGLIEFDGREFHLYTKENGLSDERVYSLLEDSFGNLWIGSAWGAMRLVRGGFITFRPTDGLADEAAINMLQDSAGTVYAVNAGWKINRFDGRRFVSVTPNLPKAAGSWRFHLVLPDKAGDWWVGTRHGLYKFSAPARFEDLGAARPAAVFTTREGLLSDDIFGIFEDSRGDVWISYWQNMPGRISRWERSTGRFHHYAADSGIPEDCFANYFREDPAGRVFIGCREKNILVYLREEARFFTRTVTGELKDKTIHDILIDRQNRLWIGLVMGGLARIDEPLDADSVITYYGAAEGLSSNHIQYLTEDNAGRIYAGTSRAMDRLDTATGEIKHFTIADGLGATGTGQALRDRNGALWIGTARGVSRFTPETETKARAPQVFIGGLKIAGKELPLSALGETKIDELTLAPEERQLQIDFYGLDLAAGEALRYQYKLEGTGGDWSEPTSQRTVSLNISPGSYRFLVRAVKSDGEASASPAVVSFTILRPVWQRWWFLTLAIILLGGLVFAIDRYRTKKAAQVRAALEALNRSRKERLVELERVRARIATDLHDDIGSSLSQIAVLSEVAQRSGGAPPAGTEPPNEHLRQISNVSNELVEAMSDIVWAINPRRDNLRDLIQRMRRFASDVFTSKNIQFRFRAPEVKDVRIGANIRREVFVIFKEAVSNIIKHAAASEVKIELGVGGETLRLEISDNGCGFEPAAIFDGDFAPSKGGNGVLNIDSRARELNAVCEFVSAPGSGTTLRLEFPLSVPAAENNLTPVTQTGSEPAADDE
jgi:signal transduction histidine kinase/ligand-binding sensor domain-containing protein